VVKLSGNFSCPDRAGSMSCRTWASASDAVANKIRTRNSPSCSPTSTLCGASGLPHFRRVKWRLSLRTRGTWLGDAAQLLLADTMYVWSFLGGADSETSLSNGRGSSIPHHSMWQVEEIEEMWS